MNETEQDEAADEAPPENVENKAPQLKGRRSFSRARRELNDEELGHPAVQKMMMDELDRLDGENSELRRYVDKYYEADKNCAILSEKQNKANAGEIIYGAMMTIGAAAIGFAPSGGVDGSPNYIALSFGVILVGAGIISKVVTK
ncbi:hypothetical protein [Blastomonas fulva]|jgi:hypothetical protein|uniref:hypothetical protein n=1 Tax=Blastomonas fulva TaxID=1550728 RepID=UPI003D2E3CAB